MRWVYAATATVLVVVATLGRQMAVRGADSGDLMPYHYFVAEYAATTVLGGALPTWNPWQLCGMPLIAALEGGVFYPPHWVHLVLPTPLAFGAITLGHMLLVAFGLLAFARRAGLGALAGVVAVIVLATRGTFPSMYMSENLIAAAAWLPLGMYAVVALVERPRRRAIALLAACVGMSLLGGHPQISAYVVYAWASLLVVWCLGHTPWRRHWGRVGVGFAAALALGAALAAVQLVPTMELVRASTRETAALSTERMLALGPWGPGVSQLLRDPIMGNSRSFGGLVLACALAGLLGRRHRLLAGWALGLAAVCAVFALGPLSPAFPLYLAIPPFAWFRFPSRLTFLVDFGIAIAAACGVQHLLRARGTIDQRERVAGWTAPLLLAAVTFAAVRVQPVGWPWLVLASILVLALASARPTRWARVATGAVLAGAMIELALLPTFAGSFPFLPRQVEHVFRHAPGFAAVRALAGHDRIWLVGAWQSLASTPKQATHARVRSLDDYAPINLQRQAQYLTFFAQGAAAPRDPHATFNGRLPMPLPRPDVAPAQARRRLLDVAAVRYVVADPAAPNPDLDAFLQAGGFRRVDITGELEAWENPRVVPRAYTVYRTERAPAADALLDAMSAETFDPLVLSFVEDDVGLVAGVGAPPRGGAASFVIDDPTVVALDVTMEAPGLVVLSDTHFTGWQATVDGAPAPIVPTNHLFRGVPVPAGRHRVEFTYVPRGLYAGAVVSLAALVTLLALARP